MIIDHSNGGTSFRNNIFIAELWQDLASVASGSGKIETDSF